MVNILFILFLLSLCVTAIYKLGFIFGGIISFLILYPLFVTYKRMANQTNYQLAHEITQRHPVSHRLMQDILVKIDESNENMLDLSPDIHHLITFLRQEMKEYGFGSDEREMVKCFVSIFSKAFPNWQREYTIFGRELERYFAKHKTYDD